MTIREARVKSKLSMRKAATTLRVPYAIWQDWEYEKTKPASYIENLIIEELVLYSKGKFVKETSELSLKELRINLGINIPEVTDTLGIPARMMQNLETDNQSPEYIVVLIKRGLVRKYNTFYSEEN